MALITLDETINIAFSVKDRHASAKWYESILGFETIYHADEAGWSELQTNTVGVTSIPSPHLETVFLFSGLPIWTLLGRSWSKLK